MLTGILREGFGDRQILLFTHEREWFHELRTILPPARWKFLSLKPWVSPDIGLRWSDSQDTLDDARVLIDLDPEAAGNRVRAIMDTQLGIISERLQIDMPYKRGDRNDIRTCIEFCEQLISNGKRRFKKKVGSSWLEFKEPIDDWHKTHSLLIAWANRGSHTGSLVPSEVNELIQTCELALSRFKCTDCGSHVWSADRTGQERLQCTCGNLQWRYWLISRIQAYKGVVMGKKRDTWLYELKDGHEIGVYFGITSNPDRREIQHEHARKNFTHMNINSVALTRESAENREREEIQRSQRQHRGNPPKYNINKAY